MEQSHESIFWRSKKEYSPAIFTAIVKLIQKPFFFEDLDKLQEGQPLSKSSILWKLDPFVYKTGILCVGGPFKVALTTSDLKNPVFMPGKSHFTKVFAYQKQVDASPQGKTMNVNHIRASSVYMVGQEIWMV